MKPLIKWSGGKTDELPAFENYLPSKCNTFIEVFAGGAALFFSEKVNSKNVILNDIHEELISFYNALKDNKMEEIHNFMNSCNFSEDEYYNIRSNNELEDYKRFYYLRKTCYRGMLRYNKKGEFNVPFGRYSKITYKELLDPKVTFLFENTSVTKFDFSTIFEKYSDNPENFLFLDPPYDSPFSDYGYCVFGKEQHILLAKLFKKSKAKCLMVISETPFIKELYKDYIVFTYPKKYKFRLHSNRITSENIDKNHLVIANYCNFL